MSRRTLLYRRKTAKGKSPSETARTILANHDIAHDKDGEVCSRPMKSAKASRLAAVLHR